jgi:hypothetical protein
MTPKTVDASQGWTLLQALEKTADPKAWGAWIAFRAAFEKARAPHTSEPASVDPVAKHHQESNEAHNAIVRPLREMLLSGALVATGSHDSQTATPTTIADEEWRTLTFGDFEHSTVQEGGQTKATIYNVRCFPLIHAADVADRLSGCSIVDAFRRCILRDPELIASSKRLSSQHYDKTIFNEGRYPGAVVEFLWPLNLDAETLAYRFVSSGFIILEDPLPTVPPDVKDVAEIIVDRWARLRRRLIKGELVARGMFTRTGEVRPIEPLQWARHGLSVDVECGDLIEYQAHKPVVWWSGLSLVNPNPDGTIGCQIPNAPQAPAPISRSAAPGKSAKARPRPMANAVAHALKEKGLDQGPGERTFKQVAGIIAPLMPLPPKTEAEILALAKAVKRHYDERIAGTF